MDIDADLKNCKYPERAIAFMDYMMSEHGQMLIYLGVEGLLTISWMVSRY